MMTTMMIGHHKNWSRTSNVIGPSLAHGSHSTGDTQINMPMSPCVAPPPGPHGLAPAHGRVRHDDHATTAVASPSITSLLSVRWSVRFENTLKSTENDTRAPRFSAPATRRGRPAGWRRSPGFVAHGLWGKIENYCYSHVFERNNGRRPKPEDRRGDGDGAARWKFAAVGTAERGWLAWQRRGAGRACGCARERDGTGTRARTRFSGRFRRRVDDWASCVCVLMSGEVHAAWGVWERLMTLADRGR